MLLNKLTNIDQRRGLLDKKNIKPQFYKPKQSNASVMKERENRRIEYENKVPF